MINTANIKRLQQVLIHNEYYNCYHVDVVLKITPTQIVTNAFRFNSKTGRSKKASICSLDSELIQKVKDKLGSSSSLSEVDYLALTF